MDDITTVLDFTGRKILITGASSGIGRQAAITLAAHGATLIATGRDTTRLAQTLQLLAGEGHRAVSADLTETGDRDRLLLQLPQINGVVHAAGLHKYTPFKFIPEAGLRKLCEVNYEAPVLLTNQLLRQNKVAPGASIVFVASIAAIVAGKGNGIYAGTKAALVATARVLALEMAAQRIRVNCVLPGMVRTAMAEQMAGAVSPEQMTQHEKLYPLGFGEPTDVANGILFLLADASRWMTGQTLVVDGGFTCQ